MELNITKQQAEIWASKGGLSHDEMAKEIWSKLSVYDCVYRFGGYHPVINIDLTREHCLYHVLCMTRVRAVVNESERDYYTKYWEAVQEILRSCLWGL